MEIAERSAIASGFSLSDIGTGGGSGAKVGGIGGGRDELEGCEGCGGTCCGGTRVVGDGDLGGGSIGCDPLEGGFGTGVRWVKTGVTGEYGGLGGVPGRSCSFFWSGGDCRVSESVETVMGLGTGLRGSGLLTGAERSSGGGNAMSWICTRFRPRFRLYEARKRLIQ